MKTGLWSTVANLRRDLNVYTGFSGCFAGRKPVRKWAKEATPAQLKKALKTGFARNCAFTVFKASFG